MIQLVSLASVLGWTANTGFVMTRKYPLGAGSIRAAACELF
ncbi:MAG: hypothetical protein ACJ73L_04085 [Actinomycetes bacterium]